MKFKVIFQVTLGTERGSFGSYEEIILDTKNQEDAIKEAKLVARSKNNFCSHQEQGTFTNTYYNLISVKSYLKKRKYK